MGMREEWYFGFMFFYKNMERKEQAMVASQVFLNSRFAVRESG
jgi:hypothetical protein